MSRADDELPGPGDRHGRRVGVSEILISVRSHASERIEQKDQKTRAAAGHGRRRGRRRGPSGPVVVKEEVPSRRRLERRLVWRPETSERQGPGPAVLPPVPTLCARPRTCEQNRRGRHGQDQATAALERRKRSRRARSVGSWARMEAPFKARATRAIDTRNSLWCSSPLRLAASTKRAAFRGLSGLSPQAPRHVTPSPRPSRARVHSRAEFPFSRRIPVYCPARKSP
jgi:hypothetical protein